MFHRLPYMVARFRFDRQVFLAILVALTGCGGAHSSTLLPQTPAPLAHDTNRHAQAATPASLLAMNTGGPAVGTFSADTGGVGGAVWSVGDAIDVSAANAAPAAVYQSQRYGAMTYTLPNLTPNAAYIVRLHFAETYFGLAGRAGPAQRLFNVALNGVAALTNFDVFAAAGGPDIALVRDIATTAAANGRIVITFTNGSANNAMISGIELLAAPVTPALSISVGGGASGTFVADIDGKGGNVSSSADPVDVSAPNAAPAAVYATQRWGPMTYTIPALTPSAAYVVRLHFDEQWWGTDGRAGGAGTRKFNVAINGVAVLTNFDVFATAGKANKAVVVDESATADASGKVTIALTNGAADNAMLSALQILPLTGVPSPAPTVAPTAGPTATPFAGSETARSSDAFVDATGVNVHLSYYGTLYGDHFGTVQSLLTASGIRHIRDGAVVGQTNICTEDMALAASGIHIDLVMPKTAPALLTWLTCTGSSVESIEGLNEYDNSGDPAWASVDRAVEVAAFAAAPQLPYLAPSLTTEGAYSTLGSMASVATYGNSHAYFAGHNPGTGGWGGTGAFGTYGSLAYDLGMAAQGSGSKPVIVTETGYSDSADPAAVPAVTKARYTIRTLLNNWNAGVPRTYLYELADEGGAPFSHYGIADASGNPKPAYTAVAALLAHLTDQGAAYTAGTLNYAFSGPSTVRHTLLQKRNGTFELIFWNEVAEWDPNARTTVSAPAQNVQVTFAAAPSSLRQSTFSDAGVLTTSTLASQTTLTLSAGAWPSIVDITP